MILSILCVALGGALGAVLRYAVSSTSAALGVMPAWLPTLIVNCLGSFVLGLLMGIGYERMRGGAPLFLFFTAGVCGGFTTFSTFVLECYALLERGQRLEGFGYMVLSLVLGVAAVAAGMYLCRLMYRA